MQQRIVRSHSRARHAAFLALMFVALPAGKCQSHDALRISTTADAARGSLRAVIDAANRERGTSSLVIEIPAGTYELTRCGADDNNGSGDLDVTTSRPITLLAKGQVLIRQSCAGERVLHAHGNGLLTLSGVTISGGSFAGIDPKVAARGGGVLAAGSVKLERAQIVDNSVTGAAGRSQDALTAVDGGAALGGGLFVGGSFEAVDATIEENRAEGGLGAASGSNRAASGGPAEGGGVYVAGAVSMRGGSLSSNQALGAPGASAGASGASTGGTARGGGLAQQPSTTAPVLLNALMISGNAARGGAQGNGCRGLATGAPEATGGAIATSGELTATNLSVTLNQAIGGKGDFASCSPYGYEGARARGGAIASAASASITASAFSLNRASAWGAVVDSQGGAVWVERDVTLRDVTFLENKLEDTGSGGAVSAGGALSVEGGQFEKNFAAGPGGAISAGAVEARAAHFHDNLARGRGGAIDGASVVADRITALRNRAQAVGGGAIYSAGDATITGSTLNQNRLSADGSFPDRVTEAGGALLALGTARIARTELSDNTSTVAFVPGVEVNTALTNGTAIQALAVEAESVTLARNGTPYGFQSSSTSFAIRATRASFVNATFSNNFGAVSADTLRLVHVTLADNHTPALQSAALTSYASVATSDPSVPICQASTVVESADNWFSDTTCGLRGPGDRQDRTDFFLGGLSDHGGIPTRAPLPSSPIVDLIPAAECLLESDARGTRRPQGRGCDLGAFELVPDTSVGATNVSIRFADAASPVVFWTDASWQLLVENRGPAAVRPIVNIASRGITARAARVVGGDACSVGTSVTCIWSEAIPANGTATITLTGRVDAMDGSVGWDAQVVAPDLLPPLDDDQASVSTPVVPVNDFSVSADTGPITRDSESRWTATGTFSLVSLGPSLAGGSIRFSFSPAPEVEAPLIDRTFTDIVFFPGQMVGQAHFAITVGPTHPAVLGMIDVDPGLNPGPLLHLPLTSADLELRVISNSSASASGFEANFDVNVVNHGPSGSSNVGVKIVGSTDPNWTGTFTWTPSAGHVEAGNAVVPNFTWRIPSLAPGQGATLAGKVFTQYQPTTLSVRVRVPLQIDFNPENNAPPPIVVGPPP